MRIENEIVSRFNSLANSENSLVELSLSKELDFFFENVMDIVVDYFKEEVKI